MCLTNTFISVDLETTGLNHGSDKITEVALVKFENGREVHSYSTLVNPGIEIPEIITDITGINNHMVKDAPFIDEIVEEIKDYIGENIVVGHSLMSDFRFLKKAMVNSAVDFKIMGIDTLKISRKLLPELEHRKLDYLCSYFNIPEDCHHRALNDARVTGLLLLELERRFSDNSREFKPYPLDYKVKKESPATKRQLEKLKQLMETYNIPQDFIMEKLTKNEASRKIDKILAAKRIVRQ